MQTSLERMSVALFLEELFRAFSLPGKIRRQLLADQNFFQLAAEDSRARLRDLLARLRATSGSGSMTIPWPEAAAEALARQGISLLLPEDPGWPPLLRFLDYAPLYLWYRGRHPERLAGQVPVSVVGARKMEAYGSLLTRDCVACLVAGGHPVVSGLALGVDGMAHRACLDYGGLTVAFSPTGLNSVYPPEHRQLAEEIAAEGLIFSEFPPDYPIRKGNFQSRNRLIAGLSLATIVIQAGARSGSMMTARLAMEAGREVYVAPATLHMRRFAGSLALIRDGAEILDSYARLNELPVTLDKWLSPEGKKMTPSGKRSRPRPGPRQVALSELRAQKPLLSSEDEACLQFITASQPSEEEVARQLQISLFQAKRILLRLERAGLSAFREGHWILTDAGLSCIYGSQ